MLNIVLTVLLLVAGAAAAQTEDDLVRYTEQSMARVAAGTLSELDHYRDIHKRIAAMPASYQFKAENLRIVGERIDILEAAEAGKISQEKARRMIVQQQADYQGAEEQKKRAAADERRRVEANEQMQREQMAAQYEAQRRAMLFQMLQNNMANRPAPYQLPMPPTRPAETRCRTYRVGNELQTTCQ